MLFFRSHVSKEKIIPTLFIYVHHFLSDVAQIVEIILKVVKLVMQWHIAHAITLLLGFANTIVIASRSDV